MAFDFEYSFDGEDEGPKDNGLPFDFSFADDQPDSVPVTGEIRPAERSWYETAADDFRSGYYGFKKNLAQQIGLATDENTDDQLDTGTRVAEMARLEDRYAPDLDVQQKLSEISEAESLGDALGLMWKNPGAVASVTLSSLGRFAPALAAMAGSSALTGGATSAAMATSFVGSLATEYGATMDETMREAGMDSSKPESWVKAVNDTKLVNDAKERGLKRGIPIAAFDMLSMGLAGKLLAGAKPTVTSVLGRSAGELGMQAGAGAAGEAAAQITDKGYIDSIGEVALEGIAEVGPGVVETAIGYKGEMAKAQQRDQEKRFDQENQPSPTFRHTHNVNGQPAQVVTKKGKVVPNTYVTAAGEIVVDQNAEPVIENASDVSLDVSAQAERIKAEVTAERAHSSGIIASQMGLTTPQPDQEASFSIDPGQWNQSVIDNTPDTTRTFEQENQVVIDREFAERPTAPAPESPAQRNQRAINNMAAAGGIIGSQMAGASRGADIDIAATSAATSPTNELPEPTEAQKEKGNYRKGHAKIQGLDIAIENDAGSKRRPEWPALRQHYGYIKRTEGADSTPGAAPHEREQVDVFIKPGVDIEADNPIFIVDQMDESGEAFDEHKVMMGFSSREEAAQAYLENYTAGWKGLGAITQATPDEFKDWLKNGSQEFEYSLKDADSGAQFESMSKRISATKKKGIKRLVDSNDGGIEGLQASNDAGTLFAMVSKDPSEPGRFRVTRFDEQGFSGHSVYNSENEAVEAMYSDGYRKPASGSLDKLAGTEAWKDGMDAVEKIRNASSVPHGTSARKVESKEGPQKKTIDNQQVEKQSYSSPVGNESVVTTSSGAELTARFGIIDASELITSNDDAGNKNPLYPAELQPRDRSRDASMLQISKIANNIRPELLGDSPKASDGAPVIGRDNVVESGNARSMAVRRAYSTNKANGYREYLIKNAAKYGLTEADIKAVKNPVLVRMRDDNAGMSDRAEFARQANQPDVAPMSPSERARSDSARITDDDMALFDPSESGNVLADQNRPFLQRFAAALGDLEAGGMSTADGRWTKQMADRVQAAVFWKAYGDERLLALMAEEADPDIKNIMSALGKAAPAFARARSLTEDLGDLDIISDLVSAIDLIRQAKAGGVSVKTITDQFSLFGDVDPQIAELAIFLESNNRSAKRMGIGMTEMAKFLEGELRNLSQDSLFDLPPATKSDIIASANKRLADEYGEKATIKDIFSQGEDAARVADRDAAYSNGSREQGAGQAARTETEIGEPAEQLTLNFDADPEDNTQADLDAREEARSEAERILSLWRGKGAILANKISADFQDQGHISLIGAKAPDSYSLALLAEIYRNPSFETFRLFFTKGDKIVGQIGITSRMPGSATVFAGPRDRDEKFAQLRAQMKNLKADGYYMLHNHPSGNPHPSNSDILITEVFRENLKGYRDHVVINGNKYASIGVADSKEDAVIHKKPDAVFSYEIGENPSVAHPVIKRQIRGPNDVADIGALFKEPGALTIIGRNNQSVTGIMSVPVSEIGRDLTNFEKRKLLALALRFQRQTGSANLFAANVPPGLRRTMDEAVESGILWDYVDNLGKSARSDRDVWFSGDFSRGKPYMVHEDDAQGDLFGKTDSQKLKEGLAMIEAEKDAKRNGNWQNVSLSQDPDDLFANNGQLPPDLFARGVDEYAAMEGKSVSFEVFVEDEGASVTMTMDAAEVMRDIDRRMEAVNKLRGCLS